MSSGIVGKICLFPFFDVAWLKTDADRCPQGDGFSFLRIGFACDEVVAQIVSIGEVFAPDFQRKVSFTRTNFQIDQCI